MYFNSYSGDETLAKDGFQVFENKEIKEAIDLFSTDLEWVSRLSHNSDIFRTKLGDIKQIQNLDFGILNDKLANLINADEFEVLNNQYF
jgi:hypothetical protein